MLLTFVQGITYVLDCMVPEKVNIMVLSQQHEEPPEYDQVEEWFGTEYKKTGKRDSILIFHF